MAVTTSAGDGVRITSSAVNETLGSQTQQTGSNTIVLSNTFASLNNGNVAGGIGYVNRLILIRRGTATEEKKLCTADTAGTGNTRILTVHENWTQVPASGDDVRVSYVIQDAATVTGLSLITKRNQDYTSTRKFRIGNAAGGNYCLFALLFGASLESVDNSSTTDPDIRVDQDGSFHSGFISAGTPVSGGELYHTPALDGELTFECVSGGVVEWNDMFNVAVARPAFNFLASTTGKVRIKNIVNKFGINDFRLGVQNTDVNGLYLESDNTGTTPRLQVRDWSTGNEVKNITCVRFNGLETVTSGQSPTIRNIQFDRMSKLLTVATGETWTIVNPIWNPATANQNDISIAGTGDVIEQFSLKTTTTNVLNSPLTSKVYVVVSSYRGGAAQLRQEKTSDSSGFSNMDLEKRRFTDNAGTSLTVETTNGHSIVVSEYGYLSFIRSYTPSNKDATSQNKIYGNEQSFALLIDTYQVETNAGTARTQGDTTNVVTMRYGSTGGSGLFHILKYTGGANTLSVGQSIKIGANSWRGTVLAINEGDSVAGTIVVDTTTGTFPGGTGTLDNTPSSGTWTATYTASSVKNFTNAINSNGNTIQQLYDYLNAKLDESTLDVSAPTEFQKTLFWANGGSNAIPLVGSVLGSPNKFKTIRESSKTQGWVIYGQTGGLGSITEFTADDGTTFVPASTVNLIVHCQRKDTGAAISGVQVLIKKTSDGSTIDSGTTDGSGDFTSSFTYTGDVPVTIDVRKSTLPAPRYFADKAANTIKSTGMNQNFLLVQDNIAVQA